MDRRTKVLFGIVILAAGGFLADRAFTSLWWEPWKKTRDEIRDVNQALFRTNSILTDEPKAQKDWKRVRDLLDKPRKPDVQNNFLEQLGNISDKVGATFDFQGSQQLRQGDFKEYVVDFKLKLTWEKYVDLLGELHNSRELLKPIRINISSQYEKDDRMDVDVRVSTIEFDPVAQKTGTK